MAMISEDLDISKQKTKNETHNTMQIEARLIFNYGNHILEIQNILKYKEYIKINKILQDKWMVSR